MLNTKDFGLVIGINHYKSLNRLEGPIEDAKSFYNWLIAENGGAVPKENCFRIESSLEPSKPLQNDIDDALAEIYEKGQVTGYRRLYFYFAGHGLGIGWNENALCLPQWSELRRNNALSSSEYLKLIIEADWFKEAFFFLDCCRNRKPGSKPLHPTIGLPKPLGGNCQSFVAYASEFNNSAFEAEHWDGDTTAVRGHFTKALVQGLLGAASNQEGVITTSSMKGFLKIKVEEIAKNNKQSQSVRFEDTFNPEGIIAGAPAASKFIQLKLTFSEPGNIIFEGPDLSLIRQGHSSTGPWEIPVQKGIYTITNTNTGKQQFLKVDGTVNPMPVEC